MKACIAYNLSAVLQFPVQFVEGKLFDPLHFPDLTECEAIRISSERLAAVGEEFDELCLLGNRLQRLYHEKLLMERKSWEGEGWD